MNEKQLEKKEIIMTEEFVRSCSWCEAEDSQYAEDVRVIAANFKRKITHGICKFHEEEELKNN